MIDKKNNVKNGGGKQPKMFSTRDVIPMISKMLLSNKPKAAQKKKGGKRASNPGPSKSLGGLGGLSKCALKYALALTDPFDPNAQGACIPSYPALDSFKTHGFVRFDGVIGTAGFGFIAVSPTLASDMPVAFVSNGSFTLSAATCLSASNTLSTGVSRVYMPNLPVSSTDLVFTANNNNATVSGRIVSCGVSVQYTGTTLNESGLVYCYRSPTHNNVVVIPGTPTSAGTDTISAYTEVGIESFDRMRCELVDFAASAQETAYPTSSELSSDSEVATLCVSPFSQGNQYLNGAFTQSVGSVRMGSCTMVIMVTGKSQEPFHCDLITHIEYTGQKVASLVTPSHADPAGFQSVLTACQNIQSIKTANPKMSNWNAFTSALKTVVKASKPIAVPLSKMALGALLA